MKVVIDLIQDLEVGEKADRVQRDVQERDHDEGGFPSIWRSWAARNCGYYRLFGAICSTPVRSHKTWKSLKFFDHVLDVAQAQEQLIYATARPLPEGVADIEGARRRREVQAAVRGGDAA